MLAIFDTINTHTISHMLVIVYNVSEQVWETYQVVASIGLNKHSHTVLVNVREGGRIVGVGWR